MLLVAAGAAAVAALLVLVGVAIGRTRCGHAKPEEVHRFDWYRYLMAPPLGDWWEGIEGCVALPTAVVWALANRELTSWQASHEAERIGWWMDELGEVGQREPLELLVDDAGRASLSDGYRRLAALRRLGAERVAVQIVRSGQLRRAPLLVEVLLRHTRELGWNR